ncbi:MAG: DUF2911 domain-containing protein [Planctomycetota bacterium]
MKATFLTLALIVTTAVNVNAQQRESIGVPSASPTASATRTVGNCKISIDYSSPGVKGRPIFGGMVPFGEVWRTGANQPATIEFSEAVNFGGKEVPAGKYVFATIPGKDSWTMIINKNTKDWGVYGYKESEDVARAEAKPAATEFVENLEIRLSPKSRTSIALELLWEKTKVSVPITVDVDKDIDKKIDEALAKSPDNSWFLFEAGDYYLQSERNLEKAHALLQKAAEDKKFQFRAIVIWRRAQVEWKLGKKDVAMKSFDEAHDLAKTLPFAGVAKEIEAMKAAFQNQKR